MKERRTLVVLPSLKAVALDDGRVVLTEKFLEGMRQYAERWDGPIAAVIEPVATASNNLDNVIVPKAALPFELAVSAFDDPRLPGMLSQAAVVLGGTDYRLNHMAAWCRKAGAAYVVNTEYSLTTRLQIVATETANPLRRWRRGVWERSQERCNRRSVALAAGVQCNGVPTYAAYRDLNENTHLYFDTRTSTDMLIEETPLHNRLAELLRGNPIRLAFSGRLIAMKGGDHLPKLAVELRRLGMPFTLSIYGGGDLDEKLRIEIASHDLWGSIRMQGSVHFKTQLMPTLQDEVDLFVCPHRQGDPSCTYLETLACGVPIVGYDNEAWAGLLQLADVGRSAPLNDPVALARTVAGLNADRELLAKLSLRAREFAEQHTFEPTFERRIEHLRQCAGLTNETALAAT